MRSRRSRAWRERGGEETQSCDGIHFDAPVLYVLDLGERNGELLRAFPDRRVYVYDYDGGAPIEGA